jgi:hypothetical protein
MSRRIVLSKDEIWLVRLFVLSRAAKAPVSEGSILEELDGRKIEGVTAKELRSVLASLVRNGILIKVRGREERFNATRQGREAVIEATARLRALFNASDVSGPSNNRGPRSD